ncbi:hypothetical protein [Anthocerotibacter panamensis]|uniref:hypothetical protein n=1 Tax=Anthocerotibacter panamensis TaxID=2857077 RepID=UPI001C4017D6|nr:hypothetical protein [Anthocerotibacter panamensis]
MSTPCVIDLFIYADLEAAFDLLISKVLSECGYKLQNPSNNEITTFSEEGEIKVIDPTTIQAVISSNQSLGVQLWKDESRDLYISWKRGDTFWKFSLFLDGMTLEEASEIINTIFSELIWKQKLENTLYTEMKIFIE